MVLGCPGINPCTFLVEAWDHDGTKIVRYIKAYDSADAREQFLDHYGNRVDTVTVKYVRHA